MPLRIAGAFLVCLAASIGCLFAGVWLAFGLGHALIVAGIVFFGLAVAFSRGLIANA